MRDLGDHVADLRRVWQLGDAADLVELEPDQCLPLPVIAGIWGSSLLNRYSCHAHGTPPISLRPKAAIPSIEHIFVENVRFSFYWTGMTNAAENRKKSRTRKSSRRGRRAARPADLAACVFGRSGRFRFRSADHRIASRRQQRTQPAISGCGGDRRSGREPETPAARVFSMLAAVTGMHLKAQEPNEPFGPMVVWAEGHRSAAPGDFRGEPVEVLAQMAARAKHPVLRARLADVCWLLERKRAQLGMTAISAYVEIVKQVDSGALKFQFRQRAGRAEI